MPEGNNDVTAKVSVTGLALGCYNAATQNYEVGLIRQGCHVLTIEVFKQLENGSSHMKFEFHDDKHRIFIDAENGILPSDPIYTTGGPFIRTNEDHDPRDFRWVVDFEKDLNGSNEVVLKAPAVPVTEMYVSKPTLYADPEMLVDGDFVLVDKGPTASSTEPPPTFGRFTEGIMAEIKCQPSGSVILRVEGPQGFQVHLPHSGGEPHLIKVDNTCPPTPETPTQSSDFLAYYSLITETNGTKFDVRPKDEGEGAVCNGSFVGVRDSLFPLPTS
jgi:hypothetical protein